MPDFQTAQEFLALLARRQGKLKKAGLPDTDKAAKSVLMDWTGLVKMNSLGFKNDCQPLLFSLGFICLCVFSVAEGSATSHTLQKPTLCPHMSVQR